MASLIISGDSVNVRLRWNRLELFRPETEEECSAKISVPLIDVERAVVIGRPNMTIPVIHRLLRLGIPCFFITTHGRWVGALYPDNNLNAARRLHQYNAAKDEEFALRIARRLVEVKIMNSRRVLQRLAANRKISDAPDQKKSAHELKELASRAICAENLDELRGYEGLAAAKYFSRLSKFFPPNIPFQGRSRHPPKDPANALLSWTYTILLGEIDCCIRAHGLDPCFGFLHELSHGAPSLSLDLLEPLRAPVCDLLVLNLLNHKILDWYSFEYVAESGAYRLKHEFHKDFFRAYETAMTRKFKLKSDAPHTDFRQVIESQVSAILAALEQNADVEFFRMP